MILLPARFNPAPIFVNLSVVHWRSLQLLQNIDGDQGVWFCEMSDTSWLYLRYVERVASMFQKSCAARVWE